MNAAVQGITSKRNGVFEECYKLTLKVYMYYVKNNFFLFAKKQQKKRAPTTSIFRSHCISLSRPFSFQYPKFRSGT